VYTAKPGDVFDFSEFEEIQHPKEIKWVTSILRRIEKKGETTPIIVMPFYA
jgi:hypothetical protein